eukprot:11873827-Alexandrium_andersonii.AAC.1
MRRSGLELRGSRQGPRSWRRNPFYEASSAGFGIISRAASGGGDETGRRVRWGPFSGILARRGPPGPGRGLCIM